MVRNDDNTKKEYTHKYKYEKCIYLAKKKVLWLEKKYASVWAHRAKAINELSSKLLLLLLLT